MNNLENEAAEVQIRSHAAELLEAFGAYLQLGQSLLSLYHASVGGQRPGVDGEISLSESVAGKRRAVQWRARADSEGYHFSRSGSGQRVSVVESPSGAAALHAPYIYRYVASRREFRDAASVLGDEEGTETALMILDSGGYLKTLDRQPREPVFPALAEAVEEVSPPAGDPVKQTCKLIRLARSHWDAHDNAACRRERSRALRLYNTLSTEQKSQIPQQLRVWLRYRSTKYYGEGPKPAAGPR